EPPPHAAPLNPGLPPPRASPQQPRPSITARSAAANRLLVTSTFPGCRSYRHRLPGFAATPLSTPRTLLVPKAEGRAAHHGRPRERKRQEDEGGGRPPARMRPHQATTQVTAA